MKSKLLSLSLLSSLAAVSLWITPAWASLEDNLRYTPPGADAFMAISTDKNDWSYFLGRKPFSTMVEDGMKDILPALGQGLGLDAEKDLVPLFGSHVSAAVYEKNVTAKEALPALIAVDIADQKLFPGVVAKLKDKATADKDKLLQEFDYQGHTFYGFAKKEEGAKEAKAEVFMTLSGNTLLFGSRSLLEQAIQAAASGKSLGTDSQFAGTLKSMEKEKFWVYFNPRNLKKFANLIPESSEKESQEVIQELEKSFNLYNSFAMGLDINKRGLRLKSFVTFRQDGPDTPQRKYLRQAEQAIRNPMAPLRTVLKAAPERPLLFGASQGFHLLPMGLKSFLADQAEARQMIDEIVYKGFRSLTHLDLDKDILSHSDGRVGLAMFYPETVKTVAQPPHTVIYLGVKNNDAFLKTLTQKLILDFDALETGAEKKGKQKKKQALNITFPKTPQAHYRGAPLYMANMTPAAQGLKNEMGIQAGYTRVGNLWFFGSNMDALKSAIDYAHAQDSSLDDNGYFRALREKYALQEDAGMFFVDLGKIVSLVKLFMGEDEEVQTLLPTLQAMKSMMAGGSYKDGGAEGVFLIDVDMDQVDFELLGKMLGDSDLENAEPAGPAEPETKSETETP
ncbi:hypothetical protein COW36_12185 [bacterium (Candidatus Blackallbacteria) CG17_big_fil_post_rev_8_21_14_2_50_48_46]|uniref:DUF3352 domain-containing protein n=1 Tax=bacterium (Candidatus Blackallbacteria) CG17_big_fil_post_rev_8_21_14_2_50_48_46 TaxID=2014261 RepID=A0A2M7G3Q6_9BACT|nr:MAG: hypothetical protein COW64_03075 [bacterium (Candidatus Blackallbacteria) CG18_big_fil_WC_8_21_14_2_50_49_26]PIW16518.1 MAG: hypothetical protein COW36_12185 [bacterium (Candidatus Blackallbacteria) CG17_big_fil_post_rev_8_21_14_2_50_48_46]PIW46026.1 MAG: hypothetical protein COW20_17450 [bacterium (Candidatus Blackallbacteria) CG13_big_fil_rev_8_21_14_2_50_49_14]